MKISGIEMPEDKSVDVFAVSMSPDLARAAVGCMVKNQRSLSPGKVRQYCKEMLDGDWTVSNDAAVVCGNEWLNANHRLNAIIESGTTQTILVLRVKDKNILRIMDGGKPRQVSDVVKMETGSSYSVAASSIGVIWLGYKKKLLTTYGGNSAVATRSSDAMKKIVTRQDKIQFVLGNLDKLHPVAALVSILSEKYGRIVPVSIGGAAYCIIREKDGEAAAEKFITGLYDGEQVSGALKVLRQTLIKEMSFKEGRIKKTPIIVKLGMILKAYISQRNGTIPGVMVLKTTEAFPEI